MYWSVIHGIKRKPHLSVVWNWYHFVAIAILHQPRPTDSADINTRLQLSDTSSIPPMHGGFLLRTITSPQEERATKSCAYHSAFAWSLFQSLQGIVLCILFHYILNDICFSCNTDIVQYKMKQNTNWLWIWYCSQNKLLGNPHPWLESAHKGLQANGYPGRSFWTLIVHQTDMSRTK